ncbi:MAG: glycosyltransferase family 1 protein [Pedosphaera sp.]|nr:glycosyltransferase family 1 protein [Pedosphaera sp.]
MTQPRFNRAENSGAQRILHVPRRFVADEWGGTETVVLEISREQQRAGWQPEILTTIALADNPSESIGGIPVRRFGYFYPYFGLSTSDKYALDKKGGSAVSLGLFSALMRAKDVRLFHLHTMARLGGQVRTAARLRKKPYVLSLHGGAYDTLASELKTMSDPTSGKFEWGKALGAVFGSRRVLGDADYIICVGQGEFEAAREKIPHDRVSALPNGVDPKKFQHGDGAAFRRKHNIPADAFVILCLSRVDEQKNQLALVEALARLRATRSDAVLVLIGPETMPEYAARIRKVAAEKNLSASVRLLPGLRTDDADLVNAYHACDVFALPSLHEPFGIVVLEAWSARRPVVVSRVGGLKTLVREGETGFFSDPGAADAAAVLAEKLARLAAQPELRQTVGDAGWKEVQAHYTWSAVNEKLETIYAVAERHVKDKR